MYNASALKIPHQNNSLIDILSMHISMYHALALKLPHQNYFVIDIVFMHISMYNACLQIIVLSVAATPTKHQQTTKVFS